MLPFSYQVKRIDIGGVVSILVFFPTVIPAQRWLKLVPGFSEKKFTPTPPTICDSNVGICPSSSASQRESGLWDSIPIWKYSDAFAHQCRAVETNVGWWKPTRGDGNQPIAASLLITQQQWAAMDKLDMTGGFSAQNWSRFHFPRRSDCSAKRWRVGASNSGNFWNRRRLC